MTRRAVVRSARRAMREDRAGWDAWSVGGLVLVIGLVVLIIRLF